jgi:hypothetical protein
MGRKSHTWAPLKWTWRQKFIYMLTLLSKGVPTKLLKFFWMKIFFICHLCQRHRWSTLSCEYLRDFWKKFEMVLMGYSGAGGKLIHKKTRSKKSRDTVPLRLKGFTWVAEFATGTYTIGTEGNRMAYCYCFESSSFETWTVISERCPELHKKCLFLCELWINFVQCILSVVMCVLHFAVTCDLCFVKIWPGFLLTVPFISWIVPHISWMRPAYFVTPRVEGPAETDRASYIPLTVWGLFQENTQRWQHEKGGCKNNIQKIRRRTFLVPLEYKKGCKENFFLYNFEDTVHDFKFFRSP